MVSWEFPPVIEGGLGRHVRKLSEALASAGHEVHVLTRAVGEADRERSGEVTVHRVAAPPVPRELDAFLLWVTRMNADLVLVGEALAGAHRFDLVHTHDWLVAEAGATLRSTLSLPWVVTVHATEHGRHQGWVANHPQSHIHAAERAMVHAADAVIACSRYMADHIASVFEVPLARITPIHNGIDPRDVRPAAGFRRGRVRARYAEKGFHVALEAIAATLPEVPSLRFVVAGTGTAEADLRAQAQTLGIASRGRFLGWIDDDTLHGLYRTADVCVVPSIYEPFGIVALEAMAAGCVPVVSDAGGLREIVPADGSAGLRVPAGNPAALSAALCQLLPDPGRRSVMARAARRHIAAFDWTAVAAGTLAVYDRLAGEHVPVSGSTSGRAER
jgi:glycogen(starch) synthase